MSFRQPLGTVYDHMSESNTTTTTVPVVKQESRSLNQQIHQQQQPQPQPTPVKIQEGGDHKMEQTKMDIQNQTRPAQPQAPAAVHSPSPLMVKAQSQPHVLSTETPLRPRDHAHEPRSAVRYPTSAGARSSRNDENNQMMPPHPMSAGREHSHPSRLSQSHALSHGLGSAHSQRHPQPQHLPPPRFLPYQCPPTPNMVYSSYNYSSPHGHFHPHPHAHAHPHTAHRERSNDQYPVTHGPPPHSSGPHRDHAFASTTPTPISRAYRSDMTPSFDSVGTATPMSLRTPLAYPLSPTSSSTGGELLMMPKTKGSPLKLYGLEPAACWTEDAPPQLWLAGEKGDVPTPSSLTNAQEKEWKKLVSYTKTFKSHNPWDYGIKENREHFNDNHKKYLELQWILDSNPNTTCRERLGAWLGV